MTIQRVCPECGRVSEFEDELAGETMACTCGAELGLDADSVILELKHDLLPTAGEESNNLDPSGEPARLARFLRVLLGRTMMERVSRTLLYGILLVALIGASLEYLAQARWEAACLELDEVMQGSALHSDRRMDLKDNLRSWMIEEFGIEPVQHGRHDVFQFGGTLRRYWIIVRYNTLYQVDGVARNHGWSYPTEGERLPWTEDDEILSAARKHAPGYRVETQAGRVEAAGLQLQELARSLEAFKQDMGQYPSPDFGLVLLQRVPEDETASGWDGPYSGSIPLDPWNFSYKYTTPSGDSKRLSYVIWSSGPDRLAETDDDIRVTGGVSK